MKRYLAILLCLLLAASLSACTITPASPTPGGADVTLEPMGTIAPTPAPTAAPTEAPAPTAAPTPEETPEAAGSNILIAYFTWAENTVVEHPERVNADATTSASVLLPGNAARLAEWIAQRTGGELFSIVVEEPYSSDYDECLDRAADEKAENARPALVNHVEDMAAYDTVFLGFPNWWYTVPMAIHSFLEEYDFSGKTIIPFVTHGTGGLSRTIEDIEANLPDSVTLLDPIGVYRPDVAAAQPAINAWLDELGYTE